MEEYKEIFDILYEIKDKIDDYQYLRLSNLICSLYNLAKESKISVEDSSSSLYDSSSSMSSSDTYFMDDLENLEDYGENTGE